MRTNFMTQGLAKSLTRSDREAVSAVQSRYHDSLCSIPVFSDSRLIAISPISEGTECGGRPLPSAQSSPDATVPIYTGEK